LLRALKPDFAKSKQVLILDSELVYLVTVNGVMCQWDIVTSVSWK